MDLRDARDQAAAAFQQRLDTVRGDQWSAPTPCADWDVRALVRHLTEEQLWVPELLAGRTVDEVGDRFEGDILGDDPKAAFRTAAAEAGAALRAPGVMDRTVHASFGDISVAHYLGQLTTDLLVHGWDLAVGTGQDTRMDPAVAEAVYQLNAAARAEIDGARQAGVFGPEVVVPDDAPAQDRLLGLLGRDPRVA